MKVIANINSDDVLVQAKDNEWKPLEVDNLPPDILTGDYEIEAKMNGRWYLVGIEVYDVVVKNLIKKTLEYRYRKIQHEPTVEDMAKKYVMKKINTVECERLHMELAYIAGYNKAKDK